LDKIRFNDVAFFHARCADINFATGLDKFFDQVFQRGKRGTFIDLGYCLGNGAIDPIRAEKDIVSFSLP